ncbi:Plasmodium exported protein, unknown function [Plasmodium ovale]|nr:Plasmodium exported protein, unknown function [Plasmodium ovale]
MNMITVIFTIITMTIVLWQAHNPSQVNDPINHLIGKKYVQNIKIGNNSKRILSEQYERSYFTLENYNIPYIDDDIDDDDIGDDDEDVEEDADIDIIPSDCEDEQISENAFARRLTEKWCASLADMVKIYADFTELMNEEWSFKMWEEKWVKYLLNVSRDLQKCHLYDVLQRNQREKIFDNLVVLMRNDFRKFLESVDEEWTNRMNIHNDI